MKQLERCVMHQDPSIDLPAGPSAPWDPYETSTYIPMEEMGNGQPLVHCDVEHVTAICDYTLPPPETIGDWA